MKGENKLGTSIRALVTGAGGFIGRHLVSFLRAQGYWVRGVDLKHPEFCSSDANEFQLLDLRSWEDCVGATAEIDEIYALAADLGGTGGGIPDQARTLHNNCLINLHCIEAARQNRIARYLYTSSTCVYPGHSQSTTNCVPLKFEENAYPATPRDVYGWANLISERLCIHYQQDYGFETRIVRLPKGFGPVGPGSVDERAYQPPCVAKLRLHNLRVFMKLKFAVRARQKVPSAISTIA